MKTQHLRQFRQLCHTCFGKEAHHLLHLLDALANNTFAQTPPELSLNLLYPHKYRTLYDTIQRFQPDPQTLYHLLQPAIPHHQPLYCFAVDTTPYPRPYAQTLQDRTIVYQPTPIKGNKPITIGHEYSLLCLLLPREAKQPIWTLPLNAQRVPSDHTAQSIARQQIHLLLQQPLFHHALNLFVADSKYSGRKEFLCLPLEHPNAVCVVRLRCNSVVYRRAPQPDTPKRGRPRQYGERFALNQLEQLPPADAQVEQLLPDGGKWRVRVWERILRRGQSGLEGTLLCCERLDAQGVGRYARPLWLWMVGQRRDEIPAMQAFGWYRQRFDVEHTFRFLKQRLLLTAYQTPEVVHEEHWVSLVLLAYGQLFMARESDLRAVRDWQRHKVKQVECVVRSPSEVLRVFGEIIKGLGEAEVVVKPRGKSPGRALGFRLPPRERHKVVRRGCRSP